MFSANKLIKQIKETEASINRQKKNVDKGLESPACYAVPLLGFLVGMTCYKYLPEPKRLFALFTTNLFLLHK